MAPFHTMAAAGIRVTLDLRAGHIRELTVTAEGRDLTPFHAAPWLDDPVVQADETLPPHLRLLSGDFFCAPFAASDVEEAPSHGWTVNSPWTVVETTTLSDGITALYRLDRPVLGATVEKRFTLHDHHPFVYQTHTFMGGEGAVPVANHAMVRVGGGGRLGFSAKAAVETPGVPIETDPVLGRSALAPGMRGRRSDARAQGRWRLGRPHPPFPSTRGTRTSPCWSSGVAASWAGWPSRGRTPATP